MSGKLAKKTRKLIKKKLNIEVKDTLEALYAAINKQPLKIRLMTAWRILQGRM